MNAVKQYLEGLPENERASALEKVLREFLPNTNPPRTRIGITKKSGGKTPAQKKQEKASRKINYRHASKPRKFSGKNHRSAK